MPTQQSIHALQRDESRPSIRRLEGKIAIITGGSCGIGEAMVKLFVKHGAKVIIADVQKARGTDLASSLYPSATFVYCDVRSEESIKNMIDLTITRYGKIDILINNAGILGDQKHRKSIVNFDPNEFDQIMQVNVRGTALGMKYAARAMMKRRSGCIISVASVAGVMGGMGPHPYTSSKHAIVGLTKNVACELGAYGIRVNCISPFGVATNMLVNALGGGEDEEEAEEETNYSRENEKKVDEAEDFVRGLANIKGPTLRAEDIAEAALYLAGDESKYVSGHNLVVDGGVTTSRNMIGL